MGGGLQLVKDGEGLFEGTAGSVDAAPEIVQIVVAAEVSDGNRRLLIDLKSVAKNARQELAFDGAEAAEQPLVGDEGIDQATLFGSGGGEALVVLGGERVELLGILGREDHFGFSVDAGFQGIETRHGLAVNGARAGRTIRDRHNFLDFDGNRGGGADRQGLAISDCGGWKRKLKFGVTGKWASDSPLRRAQRKRGEGEGEWE
jgi:hypothetical protein